MTILKCDRCGKEIREVASTISVDDGAFEYEVCDDCLSSFVDWLMEKNDRRTFRFPVAIGDTIYEGKWEATVKGLYSNGKEDYALVGDEFPGSERWINLARLGDGVRTEKNDRD